MQYIAIYTFKRRFRMFRIIWRGECYNSERTFFCSFYFAAVYYNILFREVLYFATKLYGFVLDVCANFH